MKSLSSRALRIAIITPEVSLRRRIAQAIHAPGRIACQFCCANDAQPAIDRGVNFDCLVVAVSGEGDLARKRLHDTASLFGWPPTLLLVETKQLSLVEDFLGQQHGNDFSLLSAPNDDLEHRLRSFLSSENPFNASWKMTFGRYRFVALTQQVFIGEEVVRLPRIEFEVALFLFRNVGSDVSRELLYQSVWNVALASNTRTIDSHVAKIRRALKLASSTEFVLRSIYRGGYRLDAIKAASEIISKQPAAARRNGLHVMRGAQGGRVGPVHHPR